MWRLGLGLVNLRNDQTVMELWLDNAGGHHTQPDCTQLIFFLLIQNVSETFLTDIKKKILNLLLTLRRWCRRERREALEEEEWWSEREEGLVGSEKAGGRRRRFRDGLGNCERRGALGLDRERERGGRI